MSKKYTRSIGYPISVDMLNKDLDDIMKEFFDLEELLEFKNKKHVRNYVIIRLVTIMEQFFREVTENLLKQEKIDKDGLIALKIDDLVKIKNVPTEKVISLSYHFQNIESINQILNKCKKNEIELDDVEKLIKVRHDVVHNIIDVDYKIKDGYCAIRHLFEKVLSESCYYPCGYFYQLKGDYYYNNKQSSKSIPFYDNAIKIDPKYVDAYYNKGVVLGNLGKHKEATECFDNAIKIDPKYVKAYYNKGVVLGNLGKYKEKIECYDNAIKIDPKYVKAYYNKGVVLGNLGKHKEAIECYDNAIKIDPKYVDAYYNKGVVLDTLGKHKEEIECLIMQ